MIRLTLKGSPEVTQNSSIIFARHRPIVPRAMPESLPDDALRLKHIGTLIAQRRMPPLVIVSHFEVVDDQCGGLPPRFRRLLREAFIFEALEHPLHDRIII